MVLIVDDLLKIPFDLGLKVLEKIAEQVDEELLSTEDAVRKKIMDTHWQFETGQIEEEEYHKTIEFLKTRLEEMGGGVGENERDD